MELMRELRAIGRRIQLGFVNEAERDALQRNALEVHVRGLLRGAVEVPESEARAGRIATKEVADYQRRRLAPLLYQSPFRYDPLRALAAKRGVVGEKDGPYPLARVPEAVVRKAVGLGLLRADGTPKAPEEIPRELLRRESGM